MFHYLRMNAPLIVSSGSRTNKFHYPQGCIPAPKTMLDPCGLVLIDRASTDTMVSVMQDQAERASWRGIVNHSERLGLGHARIGAVRAAKSGSLVFTDAYFGASYLLRKFRIAAHSVMTPCIIHSAIFCILREVFMAAEFFRESFCSDTPFPRELTPPTWPAAVMMINLPC